MEISRELLPVSRLQGSHYSTLVKALSNVLDTAVARTTYGQILDGLPLSSVAFDVYAGEVVCPGHPLLDEHLELSPDVLAKFDELRATAPPDTFEVDASTILEYQAASPGSRAFQTRLIELVARVVHAIAVWVYKTQGPLRPKDDRLMAWRPDKDGSEAIRKYFYRNGFPPTFFVHPWYKAYDQYPDGVADGVGYWAEDRILGGVTDAVFFHTNAYKVFYRIYRLRDDQKQQLLQFLLSDAPPPGSCPLPIHGDKDNRVRVDPEEPISETGIYRDKWERKPLTEDDTDMRTKDVVDTFNYVSVEDYKAAILRGWAFRDRLSDDGQ
ncbi:hypothetical protein SPI_08083 [Niveomyces insectorum RCEF 264]|uniref:Uncharacterized protein n=1 Tax=Niveomyces insectorum RCEF 264 TaxID=1081102 RepID=A0A167NSK3_9HYPO|nr:hypothetical protein SPI_08083 [Niveomyces insectorum RCEF 264]